VIEDVACVRFYRTIRDGVSADALRLGVGRNLYPANSALTSHLAVAFGALLGGDRVTNYTTSDDHRERALAADLLDRYLGRPGITPGDVVFMNGAQEAISTVLGHAAQAGMSAVLPLPLYYAFEQSSRRFGVPIAGHYRADGEIRWSGDRPARLLEVRVLPNGVTGTIFARPRIEPALTLVDCVFQLGELGEPGALAAHSRAAARPFDRTALVFTASKDLSLPGLRAGLLASGDRDVIRYAAADRFERLYSVNPFIAHTVLIYLAILIMNASGPGQYADLAHAFRDAGVAFLTEAEADAILRHVDAMTARARGGLAPITSGRYPLTLGALPAGGYSVLAQVRGNFSGSDDFVAWVKHAGLRHELKLNPTLLFGGTPEVWSALYPGEHHIRVNVSDEPEALIRALDRFAAVLEDHHREVARHERCSLPPPLLGWTGGVR
jgi:aspartate/methionine/tyrosine aminotransferase